MTKTQAIELFGSPKYLAEALGITRQAIYQWPDDLDQRLTDEITGAYFRLSKPRLLTTAHGNILPASDDIS